MSSTASNISVVIPTYNRPDSVDRLLKSLERQSLVPREAIIIDSGDSPIPIVNGTKTASRMLIRVVRVPAPSVCAQRNRGIREATGNIVFLCDDDMELGVDYIRNLAEILDNRPDVVAVSGMIFEPGISESETDPMPPLSALGLIWKFFFLQSVWADLQRVPFPSWLRWARKSLIDYYRKRGNTFTPAGWPIVSNLASPHFETAMYGLGAAMIRREFLLTHPFPPMLIPQGIGDHYSLAVALAKSGKTITVVRNTVITHHKSQQGRMPVWESYSWRVMALDLFLDDLPGAHSAARSLLLWSIVGNIISFGLSRQFEGLKSALNAFARISLGLNPYRRLQTPSDHLPARTDVDFDRTKRGIQT